MKITRKTTIITAVFPALALMLLAAGCGGGGGGASTTANPGIGTLAAEIRLSRTDAGRTAGQTLYPVTVQITVTGNKSGTRTPIAPVTTSTIITSSPGYAEVSILNVQAGRNHLLTAVATWADNYKKTIKCVVPLISAGSRTSATADDRSTVIADAAIELASRNSVPLSELTDAQVQAIALAVDTLYAAGIPYSEMTPGNVLDYIATASVPAQITLTPASVTIYIGQTAQFTATVKNSFGIAITGASVTWTVNNSSLGTISQDGLFTASGKGSATVTATSGSVSSSAIVTIANRAPVSNAGADQTVEEYDTVTLDASGSSDPDGDAITYSWTQVSGPAVTLTGPTTAAPSFMPVVTGIYVFELTVSDGALSSTDSVTVTVVESPDTVAGVVTSGGLPIEGAVVRLYNDSYEEITLTDATGFYIFRDIPSGSYFIVATLEDFTIEQSTVTIP